MSMPSLTSSPCMRGAPHGGLAMLISRISCRISAGTPGRPHRGLDFQRQYRRKPARCHRTTVSGRTMASASQLFGNSWQTQPRTILSTADNGTRPGLPRRSTLICCRNTRISASSAARGRNRSTAAPRIILQRANIQQRIIRFCVSRQPDGFCDRDRVSVVLDGAQFYRVHQTSMEPWLTGDRLEVSAKLDPNSTPSKPVFDILARIFGGSMPRSKPLASPPFHADVAAILHGVSSAGPKRLLAQLKDWQSRGGHLDVTSARLQQGDAIATATGNIGLTESGHIDGALHVKAIGAYKQIARALVGNGQGNTTDRQRVAELLLGSPHVRTLSIENTQRKARELQAAEREARLRAERDTQRLVAPQQTPAGAKTTMPSSISPSLPSAGSLNLPIWFKDGQLFVGSVSIATLPSLF